MKQWKVIVFILVMMVLIVTVVSAIQNTTETVEDKISSFNPFSFLTSIWTAIF